MILENSSQILLIMITDAKEPVHVIVNPMGIVIAPKDWRGQPVYAIYYWALCVKHSKALRGLDPAPGDRFRVEVWDAERMVWPCLENTGAVEMECMAQCVRMVEISKASVTNATT